MKALRTVTNPHLIRDLVDLGFGGKTAEPYKTSDAKTKFKIGQICVLTGLVDFPEFNGKEVEIISPRREETNGQTYYIKGEINKYINWVYEYRLEAV